MIKGQPRALYWRVYAVIAAIVWLAVFAMQIGKVGFPLAVLTSIVSGAIIGLTALLAFGYNFKSATTQKRVCMVGLMFCLKRLIPAVGAATFFFHMNVVRSHLNADQAFIFRAQMIGVAVMTALEFWALATLSKPMDSDDGHENNDGDGTLGKRRRRLVA